jgi:ABC-type transport system involved in multi-copper enzyme maturation permease subunit
LNAVATPTTPAAAPAGFHPRRRPSFAGAVRSELLKIRRQAMTWILVAFMVLVSAIAVATFAASDDARRLLASNPLGLYFDYLSAIEGAFNTLSGISLLLLGSRLVSMEYGSGTIRIVLARGTGRLQLLAAQYLALAIAGLLLLVAFAAVSAGALYVIVVAWHGSFAPITTLPSVAWTDTWLNVLISLTSMAVCILLGSAAAAVGRSVAFAVGVAMAFFPTDNFGTIVMSLLQRITHQDLWPKLTQWFLGPNLNHLPAATQTDHAAGTVFAPPLVPMDATHGWAVIGVYALVFLAAAVVLTWRRDVLE